MKQRPNVYSYLPLATTVSSNERPSSGNGRIGKRPTHNQIETQHGKQMRSSLGRFNKQLVAMALPFAATRRIEGTSTNLAAREDEQKRAPRRGRGR